MRSQAGTIGATAIAVAIALVAWRGIEGGAGSAPTESAPIAPGPSASEAREEPLVDAEGPETREDRRTVAEPDPSPPETQREPRTVALLARFVRPDHSEIQLASARLLLSGSRGFVREVSVVDAGSAFVADLEPDMYTARVVALDFEHREQVLELSERSGNSERIFDERLLLWPADWIAVVVRTPDGRSFEGIADELGIERKRLLVDAFDVRTRFDPPDEKAWGLEVVPRAAIWHPPPLYQSWSLPGDCIGSLRVLEPPPFWVGLAVLGVPLGWKVADPGDREVVFQVDAREFEDRLATVQMRVLDAPGGAPKRDARITLKADTSAHRRADQANVTPDSDGRVRFVRIVPGRYELSVEGDGALHQELLDLEPAEKRDVGDIVLRASAAIPIHAVDELGKPAAGWVEIAPYRRGASVEDLYPPNLHRSLDGNGEFRLPMPSEVSIVRITLADLGTGWQTNRLSRNVLLDPEHPPLGPLELVVPEPIVVRFDVSRDGFARIEVLDELGLVVAAPDPANDKPPRAELAAGRYVARGLDAAGTVLGEEAFVVAGVTLRVTLP